MALIVRPQLIKTLQEKLEINWAKKIIDCNGTRQLWSFKMRGTTALNIASVSPDFEALKLWKIQSCSPTLNLPLHTRERESNFSFKDRLMVNQMPRANGKDYLKWTPHVPILPTATLTTPQKVWSILELVKLKMLDFSDHAKTGISILT